MKQRDGNLVVYSPGYRVLWQSGSAGNPEASLALQGDGNLVIYWTNGSVAWQTGTNRK